MKYQNRRVPVPPRRPEPIMISTCEVRVGELIGREFDDETIARIVGCSIGTVRTYRRELSLAKGKLMGVSV